MAILTILILLIHKHGRLFHFLMTSSILKFLLQKSFTCLVRVTSKLFLDYCERHYFPVSFSVCLWFINRKATDFYVLVLYPDTLLKVFLSYISYLVVSLWSFVYKIWLTVNKNTLSSSFPSWILLISFGFLIALAKTSSTVLTRYGESGQPCLIPDYSVMLWVFPHLVLCVCELA